MSVAAVRCCRVRGRRAAAAVPLMRPLAVVSSSRSLLASSTTMSSSSLFVHRHSPSSVSPFHTSKYLRCEEKKQQPNNEKANSTKDKEAKQEEAPVDPQEAALLELKAEAHDLKQKLMYSLADQENLRRIAKQDLEREREYGISKFAKDMLEVVDNLARCIGAVKPDQLDNNKDLETLLEGVKMTEKNLLKTMGSHGIVRFSPLGETFDPNRMNALLKMPAADKDHNSVGVLLKDGFMIKDRVLRPADVGVVMNEGQKAEQKKEDTEQKQQ